MFLFSIDGIVSGVLFSDKLMIVHQRSANLYFVCGVFGYQGYQLHCIYFYTMIFSIDFDANQLPDPITYSYNLNPSDDQLEKYQKQVSVQLDEWDGYISN